MAARCAALLLAVATVLLSAAETRGGTPPRRLDRNLGVTLSAPRVHNLFWDASWSARSAHAGFSRGAINFATGGLSGAGGITGGTFMNAAAQYGVGRAAFRGSDGPSPLCGPTRAPRTVTAAQVQAWVTCEVSTLVTGVPPPVPRATVSNDLYFVYLPSRTRIVDNLGIPRFSLLGQSFGPFTIISRTSCTDYGAYHAFSLAPGGFFAYTVVPTRCFSGDANPLDSITVAASHELIEAATNPLIGPGWIDDSITMNGFARLSRGEAADICSGVGAAPATPRRELGVLLARYWSNRTGSCF